MSGAGEGAQRPTIYCVTTRRTDDGSEETFSFLRKDGVDAHLEFYEEHTPAPLRESRIVEDLVRFRVGQWVKGRRPRQKSFKDRAIGRRLGFRRALPWAQWKGSTCQVPFWSAREGAVR